MSVRRVPHKFSDTITAIVRVVKDVTGVECILQEQGGQNVPRPDLPYFAFKVTSPAIHYGDDHQEHEGDAASTLYNRGGPRRMACSFHCYGRSKEEAYELMSLWQLSLNQKTTQEALRKSGMAVWLIGNVADLTQLLQTGFEARSQMDVSFGIAFNLTEDLGRIENTKVIGTVDGNPVNPAIEAP